MSILFGLNPTLHRVGYSINIPKNTLLEKFIFDLEEVLGKHTTKGKIHNWFDGVGIIEFENAHAKLSMPNPENRHWSRLTFLPSRINTKTLIEILNNNTGLGLSPVIDPEDDKDYQNIPTIESKFDLTIKGFDQEGHQLLADWFSNLLIPIIPLRNYYDKKIGKIQNTSDYINGNYTHYWFAHENNDILKGYLPRRAKRASFCKIYVKYSKKEEIWFIRFESTLRVYQIKGILGLPKNYDFDLPNEFLSIINKIKNTKFTNYYDFAEVNYDKFICKITNTDKFKKLYNLIGLDDFFKLRELEKDERFKKSAFKYNLMKIISQRLQPGKLSFKLRNLCNKIDEEKLINLINQEFNINFEERVIPLYNMFYSLDYISGQIY